MANKGVTVVCRDVDLGDTGPTSAIRDSEGNLMTIFQRNAGDQV